jgi:hypothetical protein
MEHEASRPFGRGHLIPKLRNLPKRLDTDLCRDVPPLVAILARQLPICKQAASSRISSDFRSLLRSTVIDVMSHLDRKEIPAVHSLVRLSIRATRLRI